MKDIASISPTKFHFPACFPEPLQVIEGGNTVDSHKYAVYIHVSFNTTNIAFNALIIASKYEVNTISTDYCKHLPWHIGNQFSESSNFLKAKNNVK